MGNLATNLHVELLGFYFLDGLRWVALSSESLAQLGSNEETCRKER